MRVEYSDETTNQVFIGGHGETLDFGISNDPAFFQILSKSLNQNQILAVVREVICNAWDAHIDAGKKSVSKTSVAPKTIPPSKDKGGIVEKVNPKTLKTASPGSSRSEQAAAFLKKYQKSKTRADKLAAAVKLVEFKRHTKLGWWRLNITDTEAAQITSYIEKYGN